MNLTDLFDTMWSISRVQITCRESEGKFIHEFCFDPDEPTGNGLRVRIASEEVTYILGPINVHGRPTRGGSETGWGYLDNSIPKELMEAEIWHLGISNYHGGYEVHIDTVDVPQLMVEVLRKKLEPKKWRASDE